MFAAEEPGRDAFDFGGDATSRRNIEGCLAGAGCDVVARRPLLLRDIARSGDLMSADSGTGGTTRCCTDSIGCWLLEGGFESRGEGATWDKELVVEGEDASRFPRLGGIPKADSSYLETLCRCRPPAHGSWSPEPGARMRERALKMLVLCPEQPWIPHQCAFQ